MERGAASHRIPTALVRPAAARTVLHTFTGTAVNQLFGNAVASAGDVDADGMSDIIVGAYGDDSVGTDSGAAFVYSGRTGALLLSWLGEVADDHFGAAVDGAGDVNGDGRSDVIVGAYRHDGVGLNSGR